MKKLSQILAFSLLAALSLTACGAADMSPAGAPSVNTVAENTANPSDTSTSPVATSQYANLHGHTLLIYCGAGMTKPFQDIADAFQVQTGCKLEVTYANAGQLQTQINTAKEGDLYIAGSVEELQSVKDVVTASVDLVKHIPVLAVKAGNPLGIETLADLAKEDIRVVLGDGESTPIGKIANKALTDAGVLDKVNVVARTITSPEIFNALTMDQCDAIIVWKENVTSDKAEIVDDKEMAHYIKTVPAASLSYSKDTEALAAFLAFLDSDGATSIWIKYGYELIK